MGWEDAQAEKCLLSKHEDLSSSLKSMFLKKRVQWYVSMILESWGSLASWFSLISELQANVRFHLQNQGGLVRRLSG